MGKKKDSIKQFRDDYSFLSNFHYCSLIYNGKIWRSVEHLFQAMKTEDGRDREIIGRMPTPAAAKTYGNKVKLRPQWDERKRDLMYLLVHLKFHQNRKLAMKLIVTSNLHIEEGNYWHDNYWGNCLCSKCKKTKGHNHLGKILMRVRKELIEDENI